MSLEETTKILAILKVAYPSSFKDMSDEDIKATVQLYKIQFEDYDYKTVANAVNNLIKKSKYLPSISEIIEECENNKEKNKHLILKLMLEDGYLKDSKEYEKASSFVEKGIIPDWLKAEMDKYIPRLEERKLLGGKN